MRILLTNDDSHRSPLLAFVIAKLRQIGDLTVIVPKHEQSWKGKSMTRFGYLHMEEGTVAGYPAYILDGSPADCINLGIHHLFPQKPDLVVSGINAGLNTGLGFVLASGTIGACLEANIGRIPAIALSQAFDSETMNRYVVDYSIVEATIQRLGAQSALLLDKLFALFLGGHGLLDEPITWNVNFPFVSDQAHELCLSRSGHILYGSCFRRDGEHFKHDLRDVCRDPDPGCDGAVISSGRTAVTPLDMRIVGQLGGPAEASWQRAISMSRKAT